MKSIQYKFVIKPNFISFMKQRLHLLDLKNFEDCRPVLETRFIFSDELPIEEPSLGRDLSLVKVSVQKPEDLIHSWKNICRETDRHVNIDQWKL